MDYAVVLYFNKETEDKIQTIISKVADSGVNSYMIDTKIPPHVTIGAFDSDYEENILIDKININIHRFQCGDIFWASIGVFNPNVIFLAPVLTEYILFLNKTINQELKTITRVGDRGYYLPNQWVPHTAIAIKLNQIELSKAFAVVQEEFVAFAGKVNRLALAKCNPYNEIKVWNLT